MSEAICEKDEFFDKTEETSEDKQERPPCITDVEWTDYALSFLDDSEKAEGNPTVNGLRRITELLVGEIVSSTTEVLQVPHIENQGNTTVKVSLDILDGNGDLRVDIEVLGIFVQ